jgi:hypothetical protein
MHLGRSARCPTIATIRYLRAAAIMLIGLAGACAGYPRSAQALPSYARQTGQQCAACHNGFPELTPYGRLFKLNGYTFTGGTLDWPPLAMMVVPSFTHTKADQAGPPAPQYGVNDNFDVSGSLFYGGKIVDHLGAFAQLTLNPVVNQLTWDNTDIRYANVGQLAGKELVYGISLNNNPTVEDVWNSTPAWGFPYVGSGVAPTPGAGTLIEGGLAQQVLGLTPYIYWNRLVYAEAGGYRTLGPWSLSTLGVDPEGTSAIDGIAPNWRFAVEPQWGNNTWEFGTFGLSASLVPQRVVGAGTDRLTDVGFDTQYQWLGARDAFSVQARYIYENQDLGASQTLGFATSSHNHLNSYNIKGSYFYKQLVGFTVGYFRIDGSPDPLLYGGGSISNSPNSSGYTFELDYIPFNYGGPSFWPWLNMKLGLQYVHYNKFNGAGVNFDGAGTNAADNDTVFAFTWLAF